MKLFHLFVVASTLTGCSTAAQSEFSRITSTLSETGASQSKCLEQVKNINEAKLDTIKNKYYLDIADTPPPLSFTTISTFPNKQELGIISAHYDSNLQCRNIVMHGAEQANYLLYQAAVKCYSQKSQMYEKFMEGKTTWGSINKLKYQNEQACKQSFESAFAQIRGELEISNQAELAQQAERRQRFGLALGAMGQQMQQQQIINNMNRPITTNCMGSNGMVNCTTY